MPNQSAEGRLIKHSLAELLKEEIVAGRLAPAERIVEAKWASYFGKSQGSVREALNLLAMEGFVQKGANRSARVVNLSERDILEIYDVRAALEGRAAYLVAEKRASLETARSIASEMTTAAQAEDVRRLVDLDLKFHLEICTQAGNRILLEELRRLLTPLFAFIQIRVQAFPSVREGWLNAYSEHHRILDVIALGDGSVAEEFMKKETLRFASTACNIWQISTKAARRRRRTEPELKSA